MAQQLGVDLEKSRNDPGQSTIGSIPVRLEWLHTDPRYGSTAHPFVGRLGANQAFVLDPNSAANASTLEREPDAAPGMTLKQQLDLRPFKTVVLWKAALIECMGTIHLFAYLPRNSLHNIIVTYARLQVPSSSASSRYSRTSRPQSSPRNLDLNLDILRMPLISALRPELSSTGLC